MQRDTCSAATCSDQASWQARRCARSRAHPEQADVMAFLLGYRQAPALEDVCGSALILVQVCQSLEDLLQESAILCYFALSVSPLLGRDCISMHNVHGQCHAGIEQKHVWANRQSQCSIAGGKSKCQTTLQTSTAFCLPDAAAQACLLRVWLRHLKDNAMC